MLLKLEPRRKQFDKLWKTSPFRARCAKMFFYPNNSPEQYALLKEFQSIYIDSINEMSQVYYKLLKDGTIDVKTLVESSDKLWREYNDFYVKKGLNLARQKRGISLQATRFYKGYSKRNKKLPKSAPRRKNKQTIPLQDGVIKWKSEDEFNLSGELGITIHGKDKCQVIKFPYEIPNGMRYNSFYLSKSPGGNVVQYGDTLCFVAMTKVPFEWQYEPVGALGFDLNKTSSWFITLSSEISFSGKVSDRIPHTARMKKLQKKLVELNDLIRDHENTNSSQRRGIRKKWRRVHRKLKRLYIPYCEELLRYVKENKLLLCIDYISPGAGSGSFGQDKVISLLTKLCEDQGIPFIQVPSPHTTKACHKCFKECERPTNEKLKCPECGELDAHRNGAYNVKNWGWKIWQDGLREFYKWKKKNFGR